MKSKLLIKLLCLILALPIMLSVIACNGNASNLGDSNSKFSNYYEGFDFNSRIGYFVKNGTSNYKILIPTDAPLAIQQAANELHRIVEYHYYKR
jgi:hypothetical protein